MKANESELKRISVCMLVCDVDKPHSFKQLNSRNKKKLEEMIIKV